MIVELLVVLGFLCTTNGLEPPKNFMIIPSEDRKQYSLRYDPSSQTPGMWHMEHFVYNLKIYYNNVLHFNVWSPDYNQNYFPWPGDCVHIDAYLSVLGETGQSDFTYTNYFTGAVEVANLSRVQIFTSRIKVSLMYRPPLGQEACPVDYEIQLWHDGNMLRKIDTKESIYEFEFVRERFLCKTLMMTVTPKINGMVGTTETREAEANHLYSLTQDFDMGPPATLSLSVSQQTGILRVEWLPPLDYETCHIPHRVMIYNAETDALLNGDIGTLEHYHEFNFGEANTHCIRVRVEVTSEYKQTFGGTVSKEVYLPAPEGQTCY